MNILLEKHSNKNYEQDVQYVTKQSYFLLRILGIWPLFDKDLSVIEIICKILLRIICCAFVCFEGIPSMLYCIFIIEEEPRTKLKIISPTIYSFTALAKYGALMVYENEIGSCLRHIKDDWKFIAVSNGRDIMIEKAKTGRNIFTICCAFLYSATLSYHTIVPLSSGKVTYDNVTIRSLAFTGYFVLFDEQRSPAYEIVFSLQLFGGFFMYSITIVTYGFAALLVMHACAQMKILMVLMEELVDDQETCKEKNVDEKLAAVVECQIRIRNFLYLVEDTLQKGSLFEILGNTIMMCLVGYCVLMEWQDGNTANACTFLIALASDTLNIFLLCYIGEYIITTADQVAWRINMLEWYRLPAKKTRDIVLIIIISYIPSRLTAGKFIILSLKTFGDVIKSAVVYFNILRTVID